MQVCRAPADEAVSGLVMTADRGVSEPPGAGDGKEVWSEGLIGRRFPWTASECGVQRFEICVWGQASSEVKQPGRGWGVESYGKGRLSAVHPVVLRHDARAFLIPPSWRPRPRSIKRILSRRFA